MLTRRQLANAIRALAMDAVEKANSGHPGMPMGMADIAEVLWMDFLRHNPNNPNWINRDRFIISNGHGAMLHYTLLHLTGYPLTIEDLQNFRQFHSKTPGHPEFGDTPGVETTTGPLGQGIANAVGMALAEKLLAQEFNRENFPIIDHYTYVFIGDGCLMEGISHEAASLAGTWNLNKLIVFWDDNGISIDGDVTGWFTDNTPLRFESYQWNVIANVDGHNSDAIFQAIHAAKQEKNRPTLICCKTKIGYGAPNLAGTAESHGAPLGEKEIALTRQELSWHHEPFVIPEHYYNEWNSHQKGKQWQAKWQELFDGYQERYPELASEFIRRQKGDLPNNWLDSSNQFIKETIELNKKMATRKASQQCLNAFSPMLPELLGGSADLSGSNCTISKSSKIISPTDFSGNYLEYGVREFGMAAIMNGIALHHGFIPYGGTFLVFCDYARNAIRLSALMKQRVIYVLTHDSIGLGEDGPTHQPIEHAAMLRLTPGLNVWRPCDLSETAVAWQHAIEHQGPSCLLLSRQDLPACERDENKVNDIKKGGYILFEPEQPIQGILIATGSEVYLALEAALALKEQNLSVRVVSIPCCEVFKTQPSEYQELVLPKTIQKRIVIEAGVPDYWHQFAPLGKIIGINHFGASAPASVLFKEYGFTVENIVNSFISL